MSDLQTGPDWWQASDGKWYPPEQRAGMVPLHPPVTQPARSKLPFVIGGVVGVVALIVAVLVFTSGGSKNEVVVSQGGSSSTASTAPTQSSAPGGTAGTTQTTAAPATTKVAVVEKGFSAALEKYDATKQTVNGVAIVINNGTAATGEVTATFTFIGTNGVPLVTDTDFITFLSAGEKAYLTVEGDIPAGVGVADLTVTLSVEPQPDPDTLVHTFPVSDVRIEQSSTSYKAVMGTLTNDLTMQLEEVHVVCAIRSADGTLLAGAFTFSDAVAPGGQIAFEALIDSVLVPTAASAECRAAPTALTTFG